METKEKNEKLSTEEEEEEEENREEEEDKKNNKELCKFSTTGIEDLQKEIQEVTKAIEREKIKLRISNERYEKTYKTLCELQGKPVPMSKEEKEKEKEHNKKERKKEKFYKPINRKKLKEQEIEDNHIKTLKQTKKNENELDILTNEINDIMLTNQDFKEKVKILRKQRANLLKQRNDAMEYNKKIQQDTKELRDKNEESKKEIKVKELEEEKAKGMIQKKKFVSSRDELEIEYHKIIEEYIKREREHKKEQAKKRQMLAAIADSHSKFEGAKKAEVEKQIKMNEAEEISDRIPIADKLLEKWDYINKVKRYMIKKYIENAAIIKIAFNRIMQFLGLNELKEIPIIYKKAERQMAQIDKFFSDLNSEVDDLAMEKSILVQKIDFLLEKKENSYEDKSSFIQEKEISIYYLKEQIKEIEHDIENKRLMFRKIQEGTDKYLGELEKSYLSEYVHNKCHVQPEIPYNEKTIRPFIDNVEDYYKLIQMYEESVNEKSNNNQPLEMENFKREVKEKMDRFNRLKLIDKTIRRKDTSGIQRIDYDKFIMKTTKGVITALYAPSSPTEPNKIGRKKKDTGKLESA